MHFTVVFDSQESCNASFGMVFIPCAAWVRGGDEISVAHRDRPGYERGDLSTLTQSTSFKILQPFMSGEVVVVVHGSGHGTEADLANLKHDLKDAAYHVTEVRVSE